MRTVAFLLLGLLAVVQGRDLSVTIIGGRVEAKDTFNSDPYMSVSVGSQKDKTPTIRSTRAPEWNWTKVFKNVTPESRLKFHLYDADFARDDTIGEIEYPSVDQYLREGSQERTLFFGIRSQSQIRVIVKWVN